MPTFAGKTNSPVGRFAIVVSRYNETITSRLLSGAMETLAENSVKNDAVDVAWVPGAWELPLIADRMAKSKAYAAIICLGAVIRGETTHDQYINRAVSNELAAISVAASVPVLFGLLTCDTLEQAIHRAGGNVGNKGNECALAALEMADLLLQLDKRTV